MPEVAIRKNVFVKVNLGTSGRFTQNIFLDFTPDDMIAKNFVCGASGAGADTVYTIHMIGVGDIFCFSKQESSTMRNVFRLNYMLDGVTSFEVRDINNAIETGITACPLIFVLEFIKYY